MDRAKCKEMRKFLNTVFEDFENKFNVKVAVGNMGYGDTNATVKLEVAEIDDDGKVMTANMQALHTYASVYSLTEEEIEKSFTMRGEEWSLCGFKPKSHKYPFLAKNAKGDVYKFGETVILKAIKGKDEI